MRPNKCCCCELRTGCLSLLGVCIYLAVYAFPYTSGDELVFCAVRIFFYIFGFGAAVLRKPKWLWPTIIFLIVDATIVCVALFSTEYEELKNEVVEELNIFHKETKLIKQSFDLGLILVIVLFLSTAMAIWWYKQQLEEEDRGNGQLLYAQPLSQCQPLQYPQAHFLISQYPQTQYPQSPPSNIQAHSECEPPPYPQSHVQIPQYSQTQYSDSPPPYPETKINFTQ